MFVMMFMFYYYRDTCVSFLANISVDLNDDSLLRGELWIASVPFSIGLLFRAPRDVDNVVIVLMMYFFMKRNKRRPHSSF